ncbi:DUF779 domain-containing protein [Mycobacterium sp. Y57]|uniref:DUF779 domain-containing protein n=1 Tax=Mycolicibacterium xanthum TaxID=2796469 RepID=UPI001C85DCF3|nr:DUF779 domain-containing protein [Mycolicibacterium xanthum]MBX7434823.1 DUF779 domain-containing protein [Mycolicibacterium xanthum]
MDVPNRALVTEAAADLLRSLQERHGALMFHQSGGCCDGSSPMCYPQGDFLVGDRDILLAVLDTADARSEEGTAHARSEEGTAHARSEEGTAHARSEEGTADTGVPVWISGPQFDVWKHTQLVIDVVPGRGGGFSLEAPEGKRFLSRGRAFTDEENAALADAPPVTGADYERGVRPPDNGTHIVAEADLQNLLACPVPTTAK